MTQVLTHFQRVMVAAQVYAGGAVSERQAVEIARKLEELTQGDGEWNQTPFTVIAKWEES